MKEFLKKNSYTCVTMFVDQIAISIFGLVLALACGKAQNSTLQLLTGIGAALFYLFILFGKVKSMGAKDRISVDCGHKERDLFLGLKLSLIANTPNFLLAILILLGNLASSVPFFAALGGGAATAALLGEGMYIGILAAKVGGNPLNSYWISFFLIILPALLTCLGGYLYGYFVFGATKPEPEKKENE